jgi:hypothetical protein
MRFVGGVRGDVHEFDVRDRCPDECAERPKGDVGAHIVNWKANLILGPWFGTEFFINDGTGFLSNDARAVVSDPTAAPLPRARSYERGNWIETASQDGDAYPPWRRCSKKWCAWYILKGQLRLRSRREP